MIFLPSDWLLGCVLPQSLSLGSMIDSCVYFFTTFRAVVSGVCSLLELFVSVRPCFLARFTYLPQG